MKLRLRDSRGGESDYIAAVKSRADITIPTVPSPPPTPPPGKATLVVVATTTQLRLDTFLNITQSPSLIIFSDSLDINKSKRFTLDAGRYSLKLIWGRPVGDVASEETKKVTLSAGETRNVKFQYERASSHDSSSDGTGGPSRIVALEGQVFEGQVGDSASKPIVGAKVEMRDEIGKTYVTSTDTKGFFRSNLPSGFYNITASHPGYIEGGYARIFVAPNDPLPAIYLRLVPTQQAQTGQIPAALADVIDLYNRGHYDEARDKCSAARKTNAGAAIDAACKKNQSDTDELVKLGGDPEAFLEFFRAAKVLNRQAARYPPGFNTNRPSAVLVEVRIDTKGNVSSANAIGGLTLTTGASFEQRPLSATLDSSGLALFQAAEDAARKWTFEAAQLDQTTLGNGEITKIGSTQIIVIYFSAPESNR